VSDLRKMRSKRKKDAFKVVCFAYFAYFATGKFGGMSPRWARAEVLGELSRYQAFRRDGSRLRGRGEDAYGTDSANSKSGDMSGEIAADYHPRGGFAQETADTPTKAIQRAACYRKASPFLPERDPLTDTKES
jgi:hypothetical protein